MYQFSPPPFSPPPVPKTHTFLFFSSALCLFLCLRRGKVLLWYDVAPELLCPLPYAAASPTEVACCCELLLMASPGLLAGPGLRLSGVTDKRSPVELRLEYVCVHMFVCVMCIHIHVQNYTVHQEITRYQSQPDTCTYALHGPSSNKCTRVQYKTTELLLL